MSKKVTFQDREIAVKEVMKLLKKKGLRLQDVRSSLESAATSEVSIPLDAFGKSLTPLESVVKYLRENKEFRFSEIAKFIGRDQRAVGVTYRLAARKHPDKLTVSAGSENIPAVIFKNKRLSAFEALVVYLKKSRSYDEMARVLGKDYRIIWTIYNRATVKLVKSKPKN